MLCVVWCAWLEEQEYEQEQKGGKEGLEGEGGGMNG